MFVHLHNHTVYSVLDGLTQIKPMVAKAKADGQQALAITDHGRCAGMVAFYSECKKQGIKPILGCEFYEAKGSRFEKDSKDKSPYHHLILLVKNEEGYKNISRLTSRANKEGMYYKPRIDRELLEKHHEGLICLSACLAGRVPQDIISGNVDKAREDILWYKNLFGDDYYLEIQNHGIPEEEEVAYQLLRFSKELGIKLVCTNDVHYLDSEDAEAHDWLMCIQTKKTLEDKDRMIYHGDYSLKSEAEMRKLFPSIQEAFDNTVEVAEKCNYDFKFAEKPADYRMPKVHIPPEYGDDYFGYLKDEAYKGLDKRYPEGHTERQQALKNLEYELGVIRQMNFAEYFLDIRTTIVKAREENILVGPGRGSGAGSTLNYCLGITDIDPIKYDLLFERFLNPERVSMPDIDTDFSYDRKEDLIAGEVERNGSENFCDIQTLTSLHAKSIVRDCARVAGYDPSVGNKLAKMIPAKSDNEDDKEVSLTVAYRMNPEIEEYLATDPSIRKLWNIAVKLQGCFRSVSVHACGHVSTPVPCEELFPCRVDSKTGRLVCEYDMTEIEHLGNLKKDLLMLKNLTIISVAQKAIKKHYDIDVPLWTEEILYDKPALKELFGNGELDGVFQFESEGMRKFMKDLKPDCFEDIIAGVSLYRPGPMDYIPDYIEGKQNPDKIKYLCPELEPILNTTYGVIVYQEQVMRICTDLAGFTKGRADKVRKAMGKKKLDVMLEEKENFLNGNADANIPGCKGNSIDLKVAEEIWNRMEKFAEYAFNKSHAACYAAISMQTAYLKAHYPAEFTAGLLTTFADIQDKFVIYMSWCKQNHIIVHKPDVNESGDIFDSNPDGSITYGLSSIKGIGSEAIKSLVTERETNGPYKNIRDFAKRTDLNKKVIEQLIKAGAFDSFGHTRATLLSYLPELIATEKKAAAKTIEGQMSLFDMIPEQPTVDIKEVPEMPKKQILAYEKESLGYYLSGHPVEPYLTHIDDSLNFISDCSGEEDSPKQEGDSVCMIVQVVSLKPLITKKGDPMATLKIGDMTGEMPAVCFPKKWAELKYCLKEDAIVRIAGRIEYSLDGKTMQTIIEDAISCETEDGV